MFRKTVSALMVSLLIVGALALAFNIRIVGADNGTIIINADGSVSPTTAPIYTADNVTYTLTGNVTAGSYGIVIERGNIVVDGAGYAVYALSYFWNGLFSSGLFLDGVSNVTLENTTIQGYYGVWLNSSSNYNDIYGNNIVNCEVGIWLQSGSNNSISGNNIADSFCMEL